MLTALGVDPTTFSPSSTPQASVFTEGLASGNRDLREETAKTWTAGVVLRPGFLRGFSLSADWYDIKIKDAINTPEAQDPRPALRRPADARQSILPRHRPRSGHRYITGFNVMPATSPSSAPRGSTSHWPIACRPISAPSTCRWVGNYLDRLEFVASPGATIDSDRSEQYAPKYSATFDLTWQKGPYTINYGINWFSKTDPLHTARRLAGDPDYSDPRYFKAKAKWEHDLQFGIDVGKRFNFYTGVQNLFNQKPEFGYRSYPASAMGRYSLCGREEYRWIRYSSDRRQ